MSQGSVRLRAACVVLLLAAAAGCGSEAGDSDAGNSDDRGSATDTTGSGAQLVVGDTVEPGQAVIVSASNVDGETTPLGSALVDDKAVDAFLSGTDARLAADVRAAVTAVQVPADSTLFGAVVSVGCERPTLISWETTPDGVEVVPTLPKPGVQCLVPVTSVALFLVPG